MSGKGRLAWIGLAVIATLPLGCQSAPQPRTPYDRAAVAEESFTADHPAMVLGGPAATTATAYAQPPWWYSRNDGKLNIREDGATPTYEAVRVDVRDRQSSHSGRIHNSYRRRVHSSSYRQLRR